MNGHIHVNVYIYIEIYVQAETCTPVYTIMYSHILTIRNGNSSCLSNTIAIIDNHVEMIEFSVNENKW